MPRDGARTRKRLGLLCGHGTQVLQVAFVAHKHDHNVAVGLVAELLQPAGNVDIGLVLGDIVHQQRANSATVVRRRDCTVALLPCGVPDLRLDHLAFHLHAAGGELDTNRALRVGVKLVAREARQQVGLAWSRRRGQRRLPQQNQSNAPVAASPTSTTLYRKSYVLSVMAGALTRSVVWGPPKRDARDERWPRRPAAWPRRTRELITLTLATWQNQVALAGVCCGVTHDA